MAEVPGNTSPSTDSWTPSVVTDKDGRVESEIGTQPAQDAVAVAGQPQRTGSSFGAFLNLICVVIGTGSLNLPSTLKRSGWIGVLLIGVSGCIGVLSGVLVVSSLNMLSHGRLRNFNQIGYAAFGRFGRYAIYFFHLVYVIGAVGDYVILSGESFHQIASKSGHDIGKGAWKVICALVMWLACVSLKQMSEAALLSFFGFATSMLTIVIGVVQAFIHPYRSNGSEPAEHHAATHDVANGSGVAVALATISFAFCAVAVMPSIETSMRRPDRWNTVVGSSMGVVTSTYLFVAIVGYWAFGDQTTSPFLDNLPQNAATEAAKVLISLHVILAAPIIAASFAFELETTLGITREQMGRVKELVYRVLFRTLFFAAITGVALGIPFFGDVMSLVGAFSTSVLLCVIPTACYLKLKGWSNVRWHLRIIGVAVIALGVYICVMGAKGAIEDLRADIANKK
ncbi:hypothetical protein FB645_002361 [Coemansia sp. IMI 203386]|nr:hypothetical protein FB645_002361 [Coemansia sp. IMI 203386]